MDARAISLAAMMVWTVGRASGPACAFAEDDATSFTLSNGLRVVLAPNAPASRAVVLVHHDVGSGDDPKGFRGLAHLTEHMEVRFGRSVAELERWGATDWNAITTLDETYYYEVVPARSVQALLWQEAYRIAFAAADMTDAALAREKEIVKHELREQTSGVAAAERGDLVAAQLYAPDHPYRHTLDRPADVDAIALAHVQWFTQAHYAPQQTTLVVVSAIPVEQVRSWVQGYFGGIRSAGPSVQRPALPAVQPLSGSTRIQIDDYARHEAVTLTWRIPGRGSPEHAALELAIDLLAHDLNTVLVEQDGRASYTHAVLEERSHDCLVEVMAIARGEETADALITRIDRALSFLVEGISPPAELERARERVRRHHAFEADQPVARALALARGGKHPPSQLGQLTAAELGQVAKLWLSPARRVVSTISRKPGRYGEAQVKVRSAP